MIIYIYTCKIFPTPDLRHVRETMAVCLFHRASPVPPHDSAVRTAQPLPGGTRFTELRGAIRRTGKQPKTPPVLYLSRWFWHVEVSPCCSPWVSTSFDQENTNRRPETWQRPTEGRCTCPISWSQLTCVTASKNAPSSVQKETSRKILGCLLSVSSSSLLLLSLSSSRCFLFFFIFSFFFMCFFFVVFILLFILFIIMIMSNDLVEKKWSQVHQVIVA